MVSAALRLRSRPFRSCDISTAIVISPHPDDETFGCGGAVAQLVKKQSSVHIAFVTDGAASHPGHPAVSPRDIATRRVAEARVATGILGIDRKDVTFLEAEDGELAHLDHARSEEIAGKIAVLLARFAPGAVLVPCRCDGSSEHDAAFALVIRALARAGQRPRILEFPVWSWWNPLLLLRPLFASRRIWRVDLRDVGDLKERAISAYSSQNLPIAPDSTAALPPGFASMFLRREEFLFER
jgi:N-acetylglucosamine malate deacetylase 1